MLLIGIAVYNSSIGLYRTLACKGASGCRYFDPTHPPTHPPTQTMHEMLDEPRDRDTPPHWELHYVPYSFGQVCAFPANLVTLKMQKTGLRFTVLIQEDFNF